MVLLQEAIESFCQKMNHEKKFVAKEFVTMMEPAFQADGYRTPKGKDERPEILIIRDDAAGDFVLFSGVIREIRRLYPTAYITLVVSPRAIELAQCCPYVDAVELNTMKFNAEKFEEIFPHLVKFASERLLTHRFDLAFCERLGIRTPSILLEYMSGAKKRIAYSQDRLGPDGKVPRLGWDCLLTTPVPFPKESWHDVDMDFHVLDSLLQLPVANRSIEIWYTGQDVAYAKEKLAKFLEGKRRIYALVPGASIKQKQWPVENYIQFLQPLLKKEKDLAFVVLGGPGEGELGAQLQEALGSRLVVNLAGETTFRQAGAVLSHCSMYIGSDTSLMHMAAAVGLPALVVACFPASLPRVQSSIPARFYPYRVPSVMLLPPKPLDDCNDPYRYGCSHTNEMHCIRQVTPALMSQGYAVLQQRIKAGSKEPVFLSTKE